MLIRNEGQLLGNARSEILRRLRQDALDILGAAVYAVDPGRAVLNWLQLRGIQLQFSGECLALDEFSRVLVVGGGKAGGAMAEAIEGLLGDRIADGVVNVLRGTEEAYDLRRIELNGASHPIPDEGGVRGVEKMLSLVEGAGEGDMVVVLISGGGSALMPYPAEGIGLEEVQELTEMLLMSGATINELNAVRKHLSSFKGGQLARRAYPATVVSLILSDVVGDPLDTIASGPTAPDASTFQDAIDVLKTYDLWDRTTKSIRQRFLDGASGQVAETPKPGDEAFNKVFNVVVGNNLMAARAAAEMASALGYNPLLLSTRIEGEARHVGTVYAGIAKDIVASGIPVNLPAAVIVGGETTVTVRSPGKGGRNQELALSAVSRIEGTNVVIATLATDGIDGPTDAAGAIIDGWTVRRAKERNLDPLEFLKENDSFGFFSALGDTILTGPTGTNVNDLTLILASG